LIGRGLIHTLSNHADSVLKERDEKLYSRLLEKVMANAAFFSVNFVVFFMVLKSKSKKIMF
ncbi:hypothetical protein, partial [Brevibacillus reuszeri]